LLNRTRLQKSPPTPLRKSALKYARNKDGGEKKWNKDSKMLINVETGQKHITIIYTIPFGMCLKFSKIFQISRTDTTIFSFPFSFIIHMCIQGLVHFSPLPPIPPLPPSPPLPSPLPNTQQKLFCLISNFVVERV
jgi:hypothetical protein